MLAIVFVVAGYFSYKLISTSGKVFRGNPFSVLVDEGKKLQTDQYGRSNILIFGTSEDDPGHSGADLTDSIMVVSVNQDTKDAFLVSIPRDLEVRYGRACTTGATAGKINDVYQCAKNQAGADEPGAQAALREKVGEVLGLTLQYSVHVNYTALKQMVDAVGGITVMIESSDPRGIYERYVKLPNGPAHLNGEAALALARARNAEGGYGLPRSNFDREQYQQKILIALRDKAASIGTLTSPVAINSLLDAAGDNIRTNFDTSEIKTLIKLGQDIPSQNITRLDLNNPENRILNGDGNPAAGEYNYTELQAFIKAYASGETFMLEGATVAVLNASGVSGAAQQKASSLTDAGFDITKVANAPESLGDSPVKLYDQSGGQKPETLKKLQQMLNIAASTEVPAGIASDADFIVIIGRTGQ